MTQPKRKTRKSPKDVPEKNTIQEELDSKNQLLADLKIQLLKKDQELQKFLTNLTHDIRTPLNGIIGFSELLIREVPGNPTLEHYIDIIHKCNEQLLHIIQEVVGFSEADQSQANDQELKMNFRENTLRMQDDMLQLAGKNILIVEDDEINYVFLQEILSATGMELIRALNGIQAVEKAIQDKPDLIIMDIRLPIMNGLDATRKIREKGIKVPIIAQTAYAMSEDKKMCLAAGCDDYISKPVHKDLLLKKIDFHIHRKTLFPPL
jgi:CheY-like chemotaxis protein